MTEPFSSDVEGEDLDPAVRRFQDAIIGGCAAFGDLSALPLERRREIAIDVRAPWTEGGPTMQSSVDKTVGDLNVGIRIHRPKNQVKGAALIYIHGGGWTMFSLDTHDRLMREYAERAGVAVIGVDYSLSPESRFPRALNEIISVIQWLRDPANEKEAIDPTRIAIGGDSAGANLSLAANLQLRDLGEATCQAMLLNYGVYDKTPTASYPRYDGPGYNLTIEELEGFLNNYTGDMAACEDPLVLPLRADLTGLPPSFLTIAECDILADENILMADRMREHNVAVEVGFYRGASHSFLEAVSIAAVSDRALDEAATWLRNTLIPEEVA